MKSKSLRRRVAKALVVVGVAALAISLLITAVPQVVGADSSFVVLSSSMSPAIQAGDVVIVSAVDPSNIESGDVITYDATSVDDQQGTVTHRVVEVLNSGDSLQFRTKGDANEEPDDATVPAGAVIGVVGFSIPLIGYLINFANSQLGLVVLVIVPAILLAVLELRDLFDDRKTDNEETETNAPVEGDISGEEHG